MAFFRKDLVIIKTIESSCYHSCMHIFSLSNSLRIRLGHAIVVLALLPTILLTYVNTDAGMHLLFLSQFQVLHYFWGQCALLT